jgi:hypothetical protein
VAAAAVVHLLGWLGWLCSRELFSICSANVKVTRPSQGPTIGLPLGVGAIKLQLLPETKSKQPNKSCGCGQFLCLRIWVVPRLMGGTLTESVVIRGHAGTVWSSQYFRRAHLYAWLHQMQAEGDPFLQAFTLERGNQIEDKYYSFGTYRQGGRSSSTKRNNGTAQATPDEVYEHGHWRNRISKENMPTHYNEYGLDDRITITLRCM